MSPSRGRDGLAEFEAQLVEVAFWRGMGTEFVDDWSEIGQRAVMRELPARRMESAKREQVKVDSGSLIHVEQNSYSVNSRLIGAPVEARLSLDHVGVWRH